MRLTSWKKEILRAMEHNGDKTPFYELKIAIGVPSDIEVEFDASYGSEEGCPFTAWSSDYVYFPISYDGAEWVGSAPRNPRLSPLSHQGG